MEAGEVDLESVRASLDVYAYAVERISHFEDVRDAARAEIEEAMGSAEVGKVDGIPRITWKYGKSRRLNQRMLKDLFPEVHSACITETPTRTFNTVRPKDE